MKHFLPSRYGDFRFETVDDKRTSLDIVEPSPYEEKILKKFFAVAVSEGWIDKDRAPKSFERLPKMLLDAPIKKVGAAMAKIAKPAQATLTAIIYKDKTVETVETTALVEEALEKAEEKKAEAVATVARPTPCCPNCEVGAIAPASEVLQTFLTDEQHDSWARTRAFFVIGGTTGHRYRLAHRNTPMAKRQQKICFDVDDGGILHFHDWTTTPEEEILAAKLILEHREAWLRNEATCLGATPHGFSDILKNPFGGSGDGTESSALVSKFGALAMHVGPSLLNFLAEGSTFSSRQLISAAGLVSLPSVVDLSGPNDDLVVRDCDIPDWA